MSEYKCAECNHYDSDHDPDDKGECFMPNCRCEGLV